MKFNLLVHYSKIFIHELYYIFMGCIACLPVGAIYAHYLNGLLSSKQFSRQDTSYHLISSISWSLMILIISLVVIKKSTYRYNTLLVFYGFTIIYFLFSLEEKVDYYKVGILILFFLVVSGLKVAELNKETKNLSN